MKRYGLGLLAGALFGAAVFAGGCRDAQPQGTGEVFGRPQEIEETSGGFYGTEEASGGEPSADLPAPGTGAASGVSPGKAGEPAALQLPEEEGEAFGAFSLRFLQEAMAQAQEEGVENPLLSPASAYMAMLMAACGSDGVSRAEFEGLLGLSPDRWGECGRAWVRFLNQEAEGLAVRSANSVWVDEEAEVRDEYLEQVSQELCADVFHARLRSEETMEAVNDWVEERTDGMIPRFRTEPYERMVRLALLNALYLDARWEEPFEARLTREQAFYAPDGEIETAFLRDPMGLRGYVQEAGLEGVLLPYRDSSLAFLALRATDGRTPQELLADLDFERLRALIGSAQETCLDFSMPKLEIEYRQDLSEVFGKLGLRQTMTFGEADLTGIGRGTDGAPLFIGSVCQAARLEVDEDGTRAAAVTEVAIEDGAAAWEEVPVLCLDSPFLYFVVDTQSGAPLFAGVLERPAKQAAG